MKLSNVFASVIVLVILTMSISAQSSDADVETNCHNQLKANNYVRAIEICSEVIRAKGNSTAPAYRYRGLAYIHAGGIENYSKAEADFRRCVELNPADSECQYWLGYSVASLNNSGRETDHRDFGETGSPDDDSFSWETITPDSASEMRFAYRESLARGDGYNLLRLAKIENEKELLPDVKAGDILYNAYLTAVKLKSAHLLLNIAQYENQAQLMPSLKAGDILYQAYLSARDRRDVRTLIKIAVYENKENLIQAKAGDILYEAYTTAKNIRDVRSMLRIADTEAELDLMTLSPEQIRREAVAVYR